MTRRFYPSRWLSAGLVSFCVGTSALAEGLTLHSGKYEQLMLAVTPEGQIEGFYSEERGVDTTFSCAFYLQGKTEAGKASAVSTWLDEVYPGTLEPSIDGVVLTVEKGQQHPGCMNVLMPDISTGLDLSKTEGKKWIGLVTIAADKAWLQKTPEAHSAHGAYIVKDDVVGVLAFKNGAAKVEFINDKGRSFTGWIGQDQYARVKVPGG
ncbi:hypothetical protein BZK31_14090 [Pseudomonas floridensis]|uniref:Acetylornithine deacetylase n=1 Tax=Pseudomonas floridensis TaxID=1958950 RepID=A0A1X0N725_9PSED|nr:hypothetical protein [Pseudomonas floridensis]ORC58703.1 hypothetical protein BZK31_14090 [Pseudomonas floridensis]